MEGTLRDGKEINVDALLLSTNLIVTVFNKHVISVLIACNAFVESFILL